MAQLAKAKAYVERNLEFRRDSGWRLFCGDICGYDPADANKPKSKRKALRDVAVRLLPGEELSFKTLRKAMRLKWGFVKKQDEWDLSSDVRFDGLRWKGTSGFEGFDDLWAGSEGNCAVWIRGKMRENSGDTMDHLKHTWRGSPSQMESVRRYR